MDALSNAYMARQFVDAAHDVVARHFDELNALGVATPSRVYGSITVDVSTGEIFVSPAREGGGYDHANKRPVRAAREIHEGSPGSHAVVVFFD